MKPEEIIAVITGSADEDQKNNLLSQIRNDRALYEEYQSLKNVWALSSHQVGMSEEKVRKAYLLQQARIRSQRPVERRLYSFLKYAAILLLVFGAGILSKTYFSDEPGLAEIVVPPGQQARINLPDGSHAWLNSDTRLFFSTGMKGRNREVILEGEAYFQVQKDQKPFVVSTKYGEVTVLGTSFNVHAYDNGEFQATLVEGSIRYSGRTDQRQVLLSPGQQLSFSEDEGIRVSEVKTVQYTSWKDGVLIFRKEPLKEVVRKLERHFDVNIELKDPLLEEIRFTGHIEHESLLDVIEYINKTKPIRYTYNSKQKQLEIYANKQ